MPNVIDFTGSVAMSLRHNDSKGNVTHTSMDDG